MTDARTTILVVDDEASIRTSIGLEFAEIGYRVLCAEDGFAALNQIHSEIPDILLSDLNMPGMSGFDLLAVVRQLFPEIRVIAMSGSFCGNEVPSGVAADAFYEKGSSFLALLKIVEAHSQPKRPLPFRANPTAPAWVPAGPQDSLDVPLGAMMPTTSVQLQLQ